MIHANISTALKTDGRYPSYLLFTAPRDDGDFDTLAYLDGGDIEDDTEWNALVETLYASLLAVHRRGLLVIEREELPSTYTLEEDLFPAVEVCHEN